MNEIYGIDEFLDGTEAVCVGPGVLLYDLNDWLYERNRTLGPSHPHYGELTIGGIL